MKLPALAAIAALTLPLPAADWPQYHGTQSDKTSTEKIAKQDWGKPKQLWKVDTNTGFSSFAVAGGHAYTIVRRSIEGIDREVCIALNADTGKEVWGANIGVLKFNGGGDAGASGNKGGDDPEILIIKTTQKSKYAAGDGWHSDVSCDVEPPIAVQLL